MLALRFSYFEFFFLLLISGNCENMDISTNERRMSKRNSAIVFPGQYRTASEPKQEIPDIPLNIIRRMNEISNIDELIKNFVDPETLTDDGGDLKVPRMSEDSVIDAEPASCIPQITTIPLATVINTTDFYYPQCVRVKRCSGCCGSPLLACKPDSRRILSLAVITATYSGKGNLIRPKKQIVNVEEHVSCKCECAISEQDCFSDQKLNHDTCTCECTNEDEKLKCFKQRHLKVWSRNTCTCYCRRQAECGSGKFFDPFECSCRQIPKTQPMPVRWNKEDFYLSDRWRESSSKKLK